MEEKKIKGFEQAVRVLPLRLRQEAMALPAEQRARVEELRLRWGRPMTAVLPEGECPLGGEPVTGQELETLYDRFASGDDFSFVEKEWEPLMAVEYRHRHNVMWFIFLFIALVIAAMAAYQHGWIG